MHNIADPPSASSRFRLTGESVIEVAQALRNIGSRFRLPSKRLVAVTLAQLGLIPASAYVALWLRFDGVVPAEYLALFRETLPVLVAVRAVAFIPFGLYGGLWRYAGVWDLTRILLGVCSSTAVLYVVLYAQFRAVGYPRSVLLIDTMLLVCTLGGLRLFRRTVPQVTQAIRSRQGKRVLIIGAGDAGDMIVREMVKGGEYLPVGFIDDDFSKLGTTIHGVKVLGTRKDLPQVIAATQAAEALVAIPSAPPAVVRSFVHLLERHKIPITTLPSLKELINSKVNLKQIRRLAIEDLLPRSQVSLDGDGVQSLIKGKRVLVTGAGGSIGSELCRQIASLEPAELLMFDRYENGLYSIANDLQDREVRPRVRTIIGDVTDTSRVWSVFSQYQPHLVFHAAAHKHVPLMEANPCEAIKNNVVGTQIVAQAAREFHAQRFVLISTDKAANPSSVMGASKRVAELIVQAIGSDSPDTRFVTVRFGNVLGSNGSVIPRMVDQIRAGGPVTVTHPDVRRYFMLIPEAVQLVLHAASLARDRETFVLEMGEQIRILDVARNLIRLSGFVPDEEIPITFVGLRPGEKLTEELVGNGEALEPAGIKKVMRVSRVEAIDVDRLFKNVGTLVEFATLGQPAEVLAQLRRIVPTFTSPLHTEDESGRAAVVSSLRAHR